jgi:hypothetical protein
MGNVYNLCRVKIYNSRALGLERHGPWLGLVELGLVSLLG